MMITAGEVCHDWRSYSSVEVDRGPGHRTPSGFEKVQEGGGPDQGPGPDRPFIEVEPG